MFSSLAEAGDVTYGTCKATAGDINAGPGPVGRHGAEALADTSVRAGPPEEHFAGGVAAGEEVEGGVEAVEGRDGGEGRVLHAPDPAARPRVVHVDAPRLAHRTHCSPHTHAHTLTFQHTRTRSRTRSRSRTLSALERPAGCPYAAHAGFGRAPRV